MKFTDLMPGDKVKCNIEFDMSNYIKVLNKVLTLRRIQVNKHNTICLDFVENNLWYDVNYVHNDEFENYFEVVELVKD